MNLLPMSYFIEVVKHKSISKAAEQLFITQQTLSSHIAAMEKELDCCLFIRKPRFRLTAEGEIFYEYCKKFTALDQAMHQEFSDLFGSYRGILRVGISQTRSRILMPDIIAGYRKLYPNVQIRLKECTNEELIHKITNDELDVIIGDISGEAPELCIEELYREQMVLVIPKVAEFSMLSEQFAREKDLQLLATYPFVANSQNDLAGRYSEQILSLSHIVAKVYAMSDSAETCLRMCCNGIGIYICPDLYVQHFAEFKNSIDIYPLDFHYPIHVARKRVSYESNAIHGFVEMCKSCTRYL